MVTPLTQWEMDKIKFGGRKGEDEVRRARYEAALAETRARREREKQSELFEQVAHEP